ncbi:PREDICTED: NUT family member 1 [Chinchilla lanigera]|uniref:NUT midline carcinoma family member 1 n=1 Tax=Chinchilla lanigera TaxID=34839 RepID=A0A8C2YPV4_CHILA|nr:PREDICTED: NUT family member 1 [Chinchilla lanigera]
MEEMASDRASPLLGLDGDLIAGAFSTIPFTLPTPGALEQPAQEPPAQPPVPLAFSPGDSLVLSAFPSPLLVTGDGGPGPGGVGACKVIVKVKTEAGPAEPFQTQNLVVTQPAFSWVTSGAACGGSEASAPQYVSASTVNAILPTSTVSVSQEGPSNRLPPTLLPSTPLAAIVSTEKLWPGPQGAAGQPSVGELAHVSKGVYENFRRWQCYKALAWRHLSQSPDAEAFSCFLIPVLRSLARLKPTMTLEEGLPRAVQEWDCTSNYDRMAFYEMAEKFMEFEVEELQMQNAQLMSNSQGLSPSAPLKLDSSGPVAPEVSQQPVYIMKKAVPKTRAPRQRQRKAQRPPVPQAPKEIPPEAVEEYINIMEGLVGTHVATRESDEEEERQWADEEMYPDPNLLSYMEDLCSQEGFVSKVEAVIHPQFLADLLSPERERDPLALTEELEQEEGLTFAQLIQKRLIALEEEDAEGPPGCSGVQLDSSPSVSDEDEDGCGWPQPSPGPQGAAGTVGLEKAGSLGKQARETYGRQGEALDSPKGMCGDGNVLSSSSSWELQEELVAPQGAQGPLCMEMMGSGEVISELSQHQDSLLEHAKSPGHCLMADSTPAALPLCWQEGPQLKTAPSLDVGLAESASLQGQGLQKPDLGWQAGPEAEELGVLSQGMEPFVTPQKGSAGAMWGAERSLPMAQSYDQNPSPGTAGDRDMDRAWISPELWLSSDTDAVGLALPLEIEQVIKSFQDGKFLTEHQALGSINTLSLGPGGTTVPGDLGSSVIPCGNTDVPAALAKTNYCSLEGPLRANSPALVYKGNREQSPEIIQDPSNLWAESCSLLLESSVGASVLASESSKETLLPMCQGSLLVLGAQDDSFPEASQDAGSRGNPFSFPLETTEQFNILDVGDEYSLQLGVSEDTCPPMLNSYDPQAGKKDTGLSKPNHLVPLQRNQESYTFGALKSTAAHQGFGSTSPTWGTKDTVVLKESSRRSKTHNSAQGAKRRQKAKEEGEDEQLSNFTYLLASKLSLSPKGLPLGSHCALGGGGIRRAPHISADAKGLGQPPHPATKSGKQALARGSAPKSTVEKTSQGGHLGASGEKPVVQGVLPSSQPHKRRRDTSAAGRRKKHRRSQ